MCTMYIYIYLTSYRYSRQQNKWYPHSHKVSILAYFEATLEFSRSKFTCTYELGSVIMCK